MLLRFSSLNKKNNNIILRTKNKFEIEQPISCSIADNIWTVLQNICFSQNVLIFPNLFSKLEQSLIRHLKFIIMARFDRSKIIIRHRNIKWNWKVWLHLSKSIRDLIFIQFCVRPYCENIKALHSSKIIGAQSQAKSKWILVFFFLCSFCSYSNK